ncbi:hypothetical protein ACXDF8_17765 [Mycolicibacterium sp. CBM1]
MVATGVVLVGAGMVVTNPVAAPAPDLRIPASERSAGASMPADTSEPALLTAIAADPVEVGPVELVKRLLGRLFAGVVRLGW